MLMETLLCVWATLFCSLVKIDKKEQCMVQSQKGNKTSERNPQKELVSFIKKIFRVAT